ncbi:MAG: biotin--[acetyl-CoA-carboxylase] ligase [Kiritimatiellae bacterium]|jgi:BirA family biotin operon repressor/biotin-[acetyl-CoA-carboxylase] ligase|nr:biotin--[acetyl-CoA-carboxylase] ligase [Kiritimatiellia bacterium]
MSTASKILEQLKNSGRTELSSSAICDQLKISRNAVWKHVKALREQGYQIEAQSRCGYKLVASPDRPDAAEVLPFLQTKKIGRVLCYSDVTDSTNRDAAAAARDGCENGTVFCSGEQQGGRGRMTRKWFSPPGVNLYFSVVLRPSVATSLAGSLPLVAGIAVAAAVRKMAPELNPRVKWPNDILIDGKKVCGILCEMQAEIDSGVSYIVAGAGLNVNLDPQAIPDELKKIATSLKAETAREFSRAKMLACVLNEFEYYYEIWLRKGFEPLVEVMKELDALKGSVISVQQGTKLITGTASGVHSDGALQIQTSEGMELVYSGETRIEGC